MAEILPFQMDLKMGAGQRWHTQADTRTGIPVRRLDDRQVFATVAEKGHTGLEDLGSLCLGLGEQGGKPSRS